MVVRGFRRTVLVCLLLSPAVKAADSNLLEYIMPQSKMVFGVRVRKLVESPVLQSLASEAKGIGPEWQKLFAAAGFDPLRDVEEILVSSTGGSKNPPALIAVRGNFDLGRLAAGAQLIQGVPVLMTGQKGAGAVAFLDRNTVIAGELPLVRQALSRRGSKEAPAQELIAKVEDLRARYDLWAVTTGPMGDFANELPGAGPASPINSMDQFQFGLTLGHGLELAAEMRARTAEDARKLSDSLLFFQAMVKASRPAAAQNFDLSVSGRTLKIAVSVPEDELRKAIESQKGALMQRASAARGSAPRAATAARSGSLTPQASAPPAQPNRLKGYSPDTVLVITASPADGGTQVTTSDGGTQAFTLTQP